ncbi:MAG: hypothetical protein WC755_07430 [Candidatus Woesearchaeota archaeon]|jgi:hypothetical protein
MTKEKLYLYSNIMLFDFVNELPDKDYNDFQNEKSYATEDAIIEYFSKMGNYKIYFRLIGNSGKCPESNGYDFEVIGTKENLLKWNKENWDDDDNDFLESLEELN